MFNKKFISCVTRTTFAMEDTGSQNTNGSTKQQIEKLPTVPEKGDFDIHEVMHSEFFFA